jgi:eukaryotic-like serine/threonine-protein kinase
MSDQEPRPSLTERMRRQVDRLLDEADEAARRDDWQTVRARAGTVLTIEPANADARAYLAAVERAGSSSTDAGTPINEGPAPASAPASESSSFCDGRYEVRRFLGEGGKKLVYLAHDTLLDRDVAFALIKTEGLDEVGRERIRREAQAMGRLGAHPHVVSVFDLGEVDGQPFIVTELMGGGDVEGLIEKAPEHRVPLVDAIRIADEVCRGLEFAHSKQIVHRDLKPGNVWLTADGTAKIGDFGLAVATDKARLTQAGLMVGTVSYMPPEQAMGGEVTPRSDLYSLGAMLYELVTGRPPFIGDETVAIITQHLNAPPVAPSWHVPDLPPGLEALILRLLEKDPNRRPASATEVYDGLRAVSAASQPTSPAATGMGQIAGPGPVNPIYRRIFVGRESELKQLQGAYDGAASGQGGLLMVIGEPGIGKTALCEQLATYAAVRGGKTLVGHCYEEGSLSLPYLPFVEAMRTYVLERDPDALRHDLGSGAQEVARIVSEVRERVGIAPSSAAGDPEEDRWRLMQAVGGFLKNASAVQPLVIVLEDLHWADRGTPDLLVSLARQLAGTRLLLVGSYRDVEVDRSHPLSGALADLRRVAAFDRVLLRGLTPDEVARMINAITGQEIRWSFAEAVHRQTEGNPLFIQEVLRYLVEEGILHREDGRWERRGDAPLDLHIPEGLRDVIGKRLSQLSGECNRLLAIAAVIGREFTLETLRRVAELPEEQLVAALEEATHVAVLEEQTRPGLIHYRFTHAFFRQTLYEELSAPRRLRLHQQVARALEGQYGGRLDEHAAELAEHFAQSTDHGDLAKAVHYGELGAHRANAVYAYGEAARLLEQAIDVQEVLNPDDTGKRCDLLIALGTALMPSGAPLRAADEAAERTFALAESGGDRARCERACLLALEALYRYGSVGAFATPGYRVWAERLDQYAAPRSRARVYADAAVAEARRGEGRRAETHALLERAVELARELGDLETLYWAAVNFLSPQMPFRVLTLQVDLARELAAKPREGISAATVAGLLRLSQAVFLTVGDRAAAERVWAEMEELASRARDPALVLMPMLADALRATLAGDLEGALARAAQVVQRGEELGSPLAARNFAGLVTIWPQLWLGRFDASNPGLVSARGQTTASEVVRFARVGRAEEARAALTGWSAQLTDPDMISELPGTLLTNFLEAAVLLREHKLIELVLEHVPDVVAVCHSPWAVVSVARWIGAGARVLGDRDRARSALLDGLTWAESIRYRPEIALTRLELAELLLEGSPDEQLAALGHLDFVIEEFRAMKMQPSLERALRHKGLLHA